MLTQVNLRKAFHSKYPILGVLIGIILISLSIGPFQNLDTAWEYKAATGVIMWGMPFVEVQGSLINQPPLGFYTEGLFLRIFGISIETGVVLMTLFGVGCTLLVYLIGKTLYGKHTGLLASALFALTPWQLVLSNSFLIDTQCLFLSLCSLYVGILSFRRDSNKLLATSGLLFAMAFYTKLFAVFVLIPLSLFYIYQQRKKLRRLPIKLVVFCLPIAFTTLLFYTVNFVLMPSHLQKGLGYMFYHSDFSDLNAANVVPTYSFVSNFLLNYGLGYFFVASVILSLLIGLTFKKYICKQIVITDLIFTAPILLIVSLTMYLGGTLNLKVPYTSVIKYAYQTLPFFSLIAASIAVKCASIINSAKLNFRFKKTTYLAIIIVGFFLPMAAILSNIYSAHELSITGFIVFRVEPNKLLGYSFDNIHAITLNSPLMYVQYLGFGFVLSALAYSCRYFITSLIRVFPRQKAQQGNTPETPEDKTHQN